MKSHTFLVSGGGVATKRVSAYTRSKALTLAGRGYTSAVRICACA